jgi:hypothetical protein
MNRSTLKAGSVVILTLVMTSWASAIVISPNDDTYLDQTASTTVRDNDGIVIKGQTGSARIGCMEFTLPDVTVTSATLNFLQVRSWTAGVSWILQVTGKQIAFDENTITYGNSTLNTSTGVTAIGGPLTMVGGNSGQDVSPPVWRNVDMTSFFNANKGTTVTLFFKCTDTGSSTKGGTIEDREGSRTGSVANAPYIDYVPEPAAGLLLVLGSLGLLRRRPA